MGAQHVFDAIAAAVTPELAARVNLCFTFVVKPAGTWVVDLRKGHASVARGAVLASRGGCTFELDDASLAKLVGGQVSPEQLYMERKLTIKGDLLSAGRFKTVLAALGAKKGGGPARQPKLEEETSKVRRGHRFDEASLARYLRAHVAGFRGQLHVRQFNNGQSNPTFLLEAGGTKYVMRKKPPGKILATAHAVEREYRVLKALHGHIPVPKALCLCEDASVIGTPFYVMEFTEGRIFRDPRLPGFSKEQREAVYAAMGDVLARMHELDYKAVGLDGYGRPGNYYGRQVRRWSKQYEKSKTGHIEAMERMMDWLPRNLPTKGNRASLVHGDFRLDNMIFHPTENRVIAVLDWELSTIGDPLGDLAYNCMAYHLPSDNFAYAGLADVDVAKAGIPTEREYVAQYCRATRRAGVAKYHFYLGFSFFRGAAILQGVYKRALKGNASSANAKIVGALAKTLAEIGWALVEKGERAGTAPRGGGGGAHPLDRFAPFTFSARARELYTKVEAFMNEHVLPNEALFDEQHARGGRWSIPPVFTALVAKAKAAGLWNLFLPAESGLTNLEYAPLAELMGRSCFWGPAVFNCHAPDTGNMEVLHMFGTPEQKRRWLRPLLDGRIRSAFCMTEPAVASSDATNVQTSIVRDGDEYVINGRKWWTTGGMDPRCKLYLVMGKTDPKNSNKHKQQSIVLVPRNTPGVRIVRKLESFGFDDAPFGHCEVQFTNVRVPTANMVLGEGRGFEIAQARLGPGRIHHCMRMIGMSERCLEAMSARAFRRVAFGKPLVRHSTVANSIAASRVEIDSARLLVLHAAARIDAVGARGARKLISMIKVVAPQMACNVADRAIQVHGGAGVSSDFPLAQAYVFARCLRIADGPDEVHNLVIARMELREQKAKLAARM